MYNVGVEVTPTSHDRTSTFQMYAHVIGCTCDLPARALVQNIVQFNGAYGCTFCEQPGKTIRTDAGGNVHTIPFDHLAPKGPKRTPETFMQNALEAIEHKSVVNILIACGMS